MQINSKKIKKIILSNLPYAIFAYAGNKLAFAYRIAEGEGFQEKLPPFLYEIGTSFTKVFPSFNHVDLLAGISVAALMKMILYMKSKNKKKFRQGEEYGSAVWRTEKAHTAVRHWRAKNKTSETACTAFLKACVKTISLGMAVVVVCPKMIDLTCAERLLCVSLGYKILSCQDKLKFIDFYTYPLLYNNKPIRTEKYFHE